MNLRYRKTNWSWILAVACLAAVLLSTTVQTSHFCDIKLPNSQASLAVNTPGGSPVCMICLMAPSTSALVLLIAFFIMSSSTASFYRLQIRPRSLLTSFDLYIRPPPASLA